MIIMYVFYIKVKICHGLCLRWMIEVASKCNCLMKTSILILAQDCLKLSLDVQYCRCIGLAACLYSGFSILRRQRIFGNRLFFFSRKMSVSTKLYEKFYGFTQKILHLGTAANPSSPLPSEQHAGLSNVCWELWETKNSTSKHNMAAMKCRQNREVGDNASRWDSSVFPCSRLRDGTFSSPGQLHNFEWTRQFVV